MTDSVLVGIDAGLTNVTATAFDADGTTLAMASRPTSTIEAGPGRDEQDHDRLWDRVTRAITAVVDNVPANAVSGVGVAGHGHGLYGLDAAGKPVCGITSTDSRAVDAIAEQCSPNALSTVVDHLGWEPFGADPLSLLVWLQEHEPATYDRLDTLLFCKDVLTHRLTGERSTDSTEGSVFYGPAAAYDREVFAALDIEDAFAALPRVVPSTDTCGTVTDDAAAVTGLPAGTPVATGLHDVGACTLGAGLSTPGDGLVILGTWGQSVAVLDSFDGGTGGLPRRYLDGWLRYEGIRAGAACVEWFVGSCGGDWRRMADERGVDPYTVYEETVAGVEPGAGGLIFHPYLQGSTENPNSTGGFYGLRLDHTADDMLRAIYEGIAMTQVASLDRFAPDIETIRLTGGGARSETWAQIFADIADARVVVPAESETGALGAALCGGVAARVYPDIETGIERTVETSRTYEPNPATHATYQQLMEAFSLATEGMEPLWETLKSLRRETATD